MSVPSLATSLASLRRVLPALALLVLGCESRVSLGESCASASQCGGGLACELGRCRVACTDDAACATGLRCVHTETGGGVCTLPVENHCTEALCPAPLVCRDDRCSAPCSAGCLASQRCEGEICVSLAADAGPLDASVAPDAPIVLDAGPFADLPRCMNDTDCAADEVCIDDFGYAVCRHRCASHADCPGISVCDWFGGADGGVVFACSTSCHPGTDEGCPASTTCRVTVRDPTYLPEGPTSMTWCMPFERGRGEGCACDEVGAVVCDEGFTCVDVAPSTWRCVRICTEGDECAPGVECDVPPAALVIGGRAYGTCPEPTPLPTCGA